MPRVCHERGLVAGDFRGPTGRDVGTGVCGLAEDLAVAAGSPRGGLCCARLGPTDRLAFCEQ